MTDIVCDKCDKTFRADGGPAVRKAVCPHCGNVKAIPIPAPGRSWVTPRPATWQTIATLALMLLILVAWVMLGAR